jgi:hypothetical protein
MIDFSKKEQWTVKFNVLAMSADPFFANKELYGCAFFNERLQVALRSWLNEEGLWIWQMMPEEFDQKFQRFVRRNAPLGNSIQQLVRWLDRNAGLEDATGNTALSGWKSVFSGLEVRTDLYPAGGLAHPLNEAVDRYHELVGKRLERIYPFLVAEGKFWDPYVMEEEKIRNLDTKSEWDRELYYYAGLRDECQLFDRHGCAPENYFFNDFIDDYMERFDADERQEIQETTVAILANTDYDYDAQRLILPLEALQEPVSA